MIDREPGGLRILAVDDSASACKLFQAVLLRLGVARPDLRFASSSTEALQLFTQWRPDLVFVDIELGAAARARLPDGGPAGSGKVGAVDGDDLARQMLQRDPQLKLVVVTAFDRDHPRVQALLSGGAADVIVKPLLASRVKSVLDKLATPVPANRRYRSVQPAWI
ncbi:MAG: response regulator [Thermoplasmata archaeon]|nr:response regulator [Thermoplasmata archaeon]